MDRMCQRVAVLLFLGVADVTAFFVGSLRPSALPGHPISLGQSDATALTIQRSPTRSSYLLRASLAEETQRDFSSPEPDDEPLQPADDLQVNWVNANGFEENSVRGIEITGLGQMAEASASSAPSHDHAAHSSPPRRNGKKEPSSYKQNRAMADTPFLRKRTATLLKVTAPNYQENEGGPLLSGKLKVDQKTFHFLLDAWAFSGEPDAARHARSLLARMEELRARDLNIRPDVRSYTKVINAISRSGEYTAGTEAEQVLNKMEMLHGTGGNPAAKPNSFTYTAVVEAYANSGAPGSAERAAQMCETMVQRYESGDEDVTPTSRAFQAALKAYVKSDEPGSAAHAEDLFDRMEALYESGIEEVKPTSVNLNTVITAWANCGEEGSAQRAEEVLRRMEYLYDDGDADFKPDLISYNAVIDAYAKSGEEGAAQKAEEVLRRMEDLYQSGENLNAKPNVRSFNSVINAWAKSREPDNALRAQEILDLMEKLYEEGNEEVRPDVHSFSTVISAWARSLSRGKAERALNLYREMEALYVGGNKHLRPSVVSVNAVMNACAYTNNFDLKEQNRAMEIAHIMLKKAEESPHVDADQVTYGSFLKVCANQMPDCSSRTQIVESIFKKCCQEGQVGNFVLQQLKSIADEDQYQRLVGRSLFDPVRMEDFPSEWWCNVVEGRWRRRKNQSQN